jgi:epoxide hydrolase-like predicted phosphatase
MSHPTSIKGVLLVGGQVLLVKNSRDEWELPGGRIDEGEDHAQTLSREFAEELSLEIAIKAPIDSYLFEVIPGRRVFIVTYGCILVGEFRPTISQEHTEHCLWPVERLSELNLPPGYRGSIEKWVNEIRQTFELPLSRRAIATKAVVFDLGGVLIDLHSDEAGRELMEQYGLSPQSFARLTRSCFESHPRSVTELAMLGEIETSTYLEAFLRECSVKNPERLRANRLSVVGRVRKDVLKIVEHLKQAGVKCCVLSNTIALHWERLGSAREYPSLGLFDHIFASHLIGCAKPEKEAFSFVANALKVEMSECLLVDDTPLNVERAKAVGWRSILFTSTAQLQRDVTDLLQTPETSNSHEVQRN